jgi:5,10-methylene-tetrahydrofolate dehydrogenase/methenyl tetrahydrofolate cyclohydrolase
LDRSGIQIEGKEAVVLGRSNIVGIPVALLLMQRNATVTIAHSRTKDIEGTVRRADIVVAAVGRAEMVRGSWIKPGAVVIDVGINSVDDASDKRGYFLLHYFFRVYNKLHKNIFILICLLKIIFYTTL